MTLLTDPPVGRHFAEIHRDGDALVESIYAFLEAGLRSGSSALVITAPARIEQLFERLAVGNLHPHSLSNSGQLAVLAADQLVAALTADGPPEWAEFRAVIAPVLERLQPFGRGVRIYSDLANPLWDAGQTDAAIRIEDFWNVLAGAYPFSLYCGYCMDTQCERAYAAPLEELGRTHSDILGSPEDDRFGEALDRASREIFGIALTQMAGIAHQKGMRKFPSGQRTMLWATRNLPMSTAQLACKARLYLNKHAS